MTVREAIGCLLRFDSEAELKVEIATDGLTQDFVSRIAEDRSGSPVIEPLSLDIPF